jgi:glycosyltransferase involved in cell wall biosynthesis
MNGSNLLLFGCDFLPRRQPSELAFWQDAIEFLRPHFEQIVVVSINNRQVPHEKLVAGVELVNLPPLYPHNSRTWSDAEYTGQAFHRLPMATLYKTWTLLRHLDRIDEIIRSREIGVVHYMRIFGVLNQRLVRRHPDIAFSMTVPTHIDRGFPFHYPYHLIKLMGFKGMDRLVPTCEATARRLEALGIAPQGIETIHWSFQPPIVEIGAEAKTELKRKLGLEEDRPLVLWSGPLQDTGEGEFLWSVDVARRVCEKKGRLEFVFAFKPDTLTDRFQRLATAVPEIKVLETSRSEFDVLQTLAKVFLSPVCRRNRTVAPPLTWIEMMQKSVPVLTTPVAGVEELLSHGTNGFVAADAEGAADILLDLDDDTIAKAGRQAAGTVAAHYDLQSIMNQYVRMWREVQAAKRGVGRRA